MSGDPLGSATAGATSPRFHRVCELEELWDGEMEAFDVGDEEVLVVKVDGEVRAYQGICPHQSVSLVEGELDGHVLTCRAHLWQFDVRDGCGINPSGERLRRYPVRIEDGQVMIGSDPLLEDGDGA